MKRLLILSAALSLILSSCTKTRIAEVTIRYEVEATNPNRSFSVYYANDWFGEDVERNVNTTLFTKDLDGNIETFVTKSDEEMNRNFQKIQEAYKVIKKAFIKAKTRP